MNCHDRESLSSTSCDRVGSTPLPQPQQALSLPPPLNFQVIGLHGIMRRRVTKVKTDSLPCSGKLENRILKVKLVLSNRLPLQSLSN